MSSASPSSCVAITRCLLLATLALSGEGRASDRSALRGTERKVCVSLLFVSVWCVNGWVVPTLVT